MRHTIPYRVLNEIYDRPWAITPQALTTILGILERPAADLEAVAARLGRPLDNAGNGAEIRPGGVGVLGVEGPLFRYANLFTELSGATSVERLAVDFQGMIDNPNVRQIVLNVNSPGGQVDGIQEFADQVRAGAKTKPVTAYVDGLAASAGYWIAAAAPKIATSESGMLGSIGVVAAITDNRDAKERQGVRSYEIVSSHAPFKRPDVRTEEGRGQILEMVDSLEAIFLERMAAFRGTTVDQVIGNFGQGKVFGARRAMAAGMADEITSFEPLVARLAADTAPRATTISMHQKETPMADTTQPAAPAAPAAIPATAATTVDPTTTALHVIGSVTANALTPGTITIVPERERIAAILNSTEAQGRDQLARTLALETNMDVETARRILGAAPAPAAAAPPNPLAAEMAKLKNPVVGIKGDGVDDSPQAEADRVLAFVPKSRKYGAA
jgi:signal peptide peptidase SppA